VLEHGGLVFDGDLERGLAFYEQQLGRDAGLSPATVAGEATTRDEVSNEIGADRLLLAAPDREIARWQFDFLREQGLEARHRVLEVGCRNLIAAVPLLSFLERDHYWGFEQDRTLLDAGYRVELPRAGLSADLGHFVANDTFELNGAQGTFDFAVANSLFCSLPFNSVARCIAAVVRKLGPSGRFYATVFENPDPQSFEPIERGNGMTTYPDREPYHYPFRQLVDLCESLGASVARLDTSTHPRGERVVCIRRVVEPGTASCW
jgi:SAM-dependent methyltransferase